jgi:hypothetical protein
MFTALNLIFSAKKNAIRGNYAPIGVARMPRCAYLAFTLDFFLKIDSTDKTNITLNAGADYRMNYFRKEAFYVR